MAAFYCLGVDNAHVVVGGPEMPILDGSSAPFLELIEEAGLKTQNASKEYFLVKKKKTIKINNMNKPNKVNMFCQDILR